MGVRTNFLHIPVPGVDNPAVGRQSGSGTMARKLRVQYPGAVYHVMNRGDRRELIYADDQDRLLFLDTLAVRVFASAMGV